MYQHFALMLSIPLALINLNAAQAHAQESNARQWQDATGKFSVQAELVSADEKSVKLRLQNGKVISVPIRKLSVQDQDFVGEKTAPVTRQSIDKLLLGPPLKPQEAQLTELHHLLRISVFIDKRPHEKSSWAESTLQLKAGHRSLQDQLEDTLEPLGLSWYGTQTVLVITSSQTMRSMNEQRFYRIKTPASPARLEIDTVINELHQVSPDSWLEKGAHGTARGLPHLSRSSFVWYMVSQSPLVHRQIAKKFGLRPLPHQYVHELDGVRVSVSLRGAQIPDILDSISTQVGLPIEQSKGLVLAGIDLSEERYTCNIDLRSVSAKDALDLVLSRVDCTWVEDGKKLVVMTLDEAEDRITKKRFVARSFRSAGVRGAASLTEAITSGVAPDTWIQYGGKGVITSDGNRGGVLVVEQGQPTLRHVEQFIADLNSIR